MTAPRGFTLIEMLTTVAVLVILLGVMVSLARYVRNQSAEQLTRDLLRQLDEVTRDYRRRSPRGLDGVTPLLPPDSAPGTTPNEAFLQASALQNNEDFVRILRGDILHTDSPPDDAATQPSGAPGDAPGTPSAERSRDRFGNVPLSLYNEATLRDAWGKPIVFMAQMHPAIGMASGSQTSFFFSAGPDGRYLTRDDNLYSYETTPGTATPAPIPDR